MSLSKENHYVIIEDCICCDKFDTCKNLTIYNSCEAWLENKIKIDCESMHEIGVTDKDINEFEKDILKNKIIR